MTDPTDHLASGELVTTEWSLVLDGPLGSLGDRYEMNGLGEQAARERKARWNALRPEVGTTLRRRERRIVLGDWEVQA